MSLISSYPPITVEQIDSATMEQEWICITEVADNILSKTA
jgi:S-adenosylmethionine:tRNA-ribosyltransferase-isomerase (queuine synthetase)